MGNDISTISRDIFKAIHEGKWLSIRYKNKKEDITKYWIGIISVNPRQKTLVVEGLHLKEYKIAELTIYIDSILSSSIIEGSYYQTDTRLIEDIKLNPHKYQSIFHSVANL